jgi:hypothetical protein
MLRLTVKKGFKVPFGNAIATVTKAVGIKPCARCEERRKKFNVVVSLPCLRKS